MSTKTYSQFQALAQTRKRKLDNNTYLIVYDDHFAIKLHNTEIIEHWPDRVVLRTGGWKTVTTKDRMNKFTNLSVYQDKGVWYLSVGGHGIPFGEDMTILNDGTIIGQGEDPREQVKWRKAANQYAKDYAEALFAGDVPRPSGGDCWGCLMVDKSTGETLISKDDHMRSHIEEKYYVPAILLRVKNRMSPLAHSIIEDIWQGNRPPLYALVKEQVQRAVRWYALHEMGLTT